MDLFFSLQFRDKAALCIAGSTESAYNMDSSGGHLNHLKLTATGEAGLQELYEKNAPPAWKYCQEKHPVEITIAHYILGVVEDAFGYGHASQKSIENLEVIALRCCG